MNERIQPVCIGTDDHGELVWGVIEMPRWQMIMFPKRYEGSLSVQWMELSAYDKAGWELQKHDARSLIEPWGHNRIEKRNPRKSLGHAN
jgi:hypothetical protein